MNIEFLIVGQGISGTWLSYFLQKQNRSFHVIDDGNPNSSSRLAAGVINPVTGRRHVEVWMAEQILPFSWEAYSKIGNELGMQAISEKSIIDLFPTAQMRHSFMQRVEEKPGYVFEFLPAETYHPYFHFELGAGEIKPVYTVHLDKLLPAWRSELIGQGCLSQQVFSPEELLIEKNKIKYREITAEKIIFCDGYASASSQYFKLLPFAPNKGEMLIVDIPDLPANHIYKKGMVLVPLSEPGKWWVGSDYKWEFNDSNPTDAFREKTSMLLKNWVKLPFNIIDHVAGIRPATLERRPFVGMHPVYPNIGILNGMGTKGCSLAPYFAKQLMQHLCLDEPIMPEADIARYSKILSK